MLNLRNLKIDNASLGQKKLLVEIVPAYEYNDKQRTDKITGSNWIRLVGNQKLCLDCYESYDRFHV